MSKNKNTWSTTAERFISYFDIMGFKSMIKTDKLLDLYNKFMTLIKTNIKGNRRSRITYYIYSDLIVVVTQDSSQDSLKQLLEASVKITNQILNLDWGVSGSIAKGKLVFDKHNQIFLGQPVVDAYLAQEDVEFYGIVICDSAVDDVKKYLSDVKSKRITKHLVNLLKEERLHFKTGYYSQYHLCWFKYFYNEKGSTHPYYIRNTTDEHVKQKLEVMFQNTKGKARRYIENTIELLNKN